MGFVAFHLLGKDLYSGRVKGIGREEGSLYIFRTDSDMKSKCETQTSQKIVAEDSEEIAPDDYIPTDTQNDVTSTSLSGVPDEILHTQHKDMLLQDSNVDSMSSRKSSRLTKPPIWMKDYMTTAVGQNRLSGAKPVNTPLETNLRLTSAEFDQAAGIQGDDVLIDNSAYQRLVGKLMYATITRPDISYVVQTLSQFMQHPKRSHWEATIRVVRYLKGTVSQGIWLKAQPPTTLTCWCDSNWAACPNTRRSVTGYIVKFGDSLVSWKSKKQQTVSRSSAEAEYRSMASAVAEVTWLIGLFNELNVPIQMPITDH
uniref:Reverse transcriptase Ty1/copia-type domain-containing protein n=1 Tax=Solanum lycopersicum TaxID=4081 RepID=A0A3Q7G9M0_SOLLC